MSEEAFAAGMRAIYVQSLQIGRVQTLRKAAVLGLKTILSFDRHRILTLLEQCSAGWHAGDKVFWIQLSEDEKDLLRDVHKAIGWVDTERAPSSRTETIALALLAGGDGDAIAAVLTACATANQGKFKCL
jgi:hypothetical protein